MSQSAGIIPVSEDLRRSVGPYTEVDPNEVYRRKLLLMSERLRVALRQSDAPSAHSDVSEFLDDLFTIRDSLLQNESRSCAGSAPSLKPPGSAKVS
jgi:phosphoenolpyruvate carboxylase